MMKRIDVAIAIVTHAGRVLVCRRRPNAAFGGYWEFPGGKREPGETLDQCLARELMEELAIRAEPIRPLDVIEHDYPHARIRLHPFVCRLEHDSGLPRAIACDETRWIAPAELPDYQFPPANEPLLAQAITHLTAPTASEGRADAPPHR